MEITQTFDIQAIETLVPHRFENILADYVEKGIDHGVSCGKIVLKIEEKDVFGRDIFSAVRPDGKKIVLAPIFLEILALGSIVCSDRADPSLPVFFTGISNFVKHRDFFVGERAIGEARKVKDKAGFLVCDGKLSTDDDVICTANMMAFFPETMPTEPDKASKKPSQTQVNPDQWVPLSKQPQFKAESMFMSDALVQVELNESKVVGQYTFPSTHPLVKGHFPGNPILMGVLQWMTVEDTALALARYLYETEGRPVTCISGDAELIHKEGGFVVAEIREFTVAILEKDGAPYQGDMVKTQKVSFRDSVTPNQTIYIVLKNLVLS